MIFFMDRKIDAIVIKKIILLFSRSYQREWNLSYVGSVWTVGAETLPSFLIEAF